MANEAYYTSEHYSQQRRLLINGDPRALLCFCVDVSESMDEYWIEEGGLNRYTGSGYSDGHDVRNFRLSDIKPGYAYYKKIDKLNETLKSLLRELKQERDLKNQVAISIVTYSKYAKVKYDFLDCSVLNIDACECKVEKNETAMSDGLRTSLAQLDEMQNELRSVDNDFYTPILIFMTDGTPTDDPSREFEIIRDRVRNEDLYVFPLGIGNGADMARLRNMFPLDQIPHNFSERYKMVNPEDYARIFKEIKEHVRRRNKVMVSEGNSEQSVPAVENEDVVNNQMGHSVLLDILKGTVSKNKN